MFMMFSFVALFLPICFYSALGLNCGDLSGLWQNELGSTMLIKHDASSDFISGRYDTKVTSTPGTAITSSNITGWFIPMKDGALVSFTVFFNGGSSITVWVGQCNICEGKEFIFTTFALRKYIKESNKRWMSTVLNQNTFWRVTEQSEDYNLENMDTAEVLDHFEYEKDNSLITGDWTAEDGSRIQLSPVGLGSELQGKFGEQQLGGQYSYKDDFVGISFIGASATKETIRASAGHVDRNEIENQQLLQTSWLEHIFTPNCKKPRNLVRFGIQNYARDHIYSQYPASKAEGFFEKIRNFFKSLF